LLSLLVWAGTMTYLDRHGVPKQFGDLRDFRDTWAVKDDPTHRFGGVIQGFLDAVMLLSWSIFYVGLRQMSGSIVGVDRRQISALSRPLRGTGFVLDRVGQAGFAPLRAPLALVAALLTFVVWVGGWVLYGLLRFGVMPTVGLIVRKLYGRDGLVGLLALLGAAMFFLSNAAQWLGT
jgi:hypothetical protein